MIWPDIVNGCFEVLGGAFVALSIRKTLKDKRVRGVSWLTTAFFAAWGWWNLFYYPSLGQWVSFAGGIGVVAANTTWVALLVWYTVKERDVR